MFRYNAKIIESIGKLKKTEMAISAITYAELIFGARNKDEKRIIEKHLSGLHILHINKEISNIFIELMKEYSLSHKISIPDALIASTAISTKSTLFTLNIKDFHYLKELKIMRI